MIFKYVSEDLEDVSEETVASANRNYVGTGVFKKAKKEKVSSAESLIIQRCLPS